MQDDCELLRHTVATVAYRAGKVLRDAPPEFANYKPAETTRTPLEILSHMGDLFEWALHLAKGERVWNEAALQSWNEALTRFFSALGRFDAYLASGEAPELDVQRIFQGPIADSLTHTGQIAMLRRMFGSPIRGENFHKAEITIGRTGIDQAPPRREFD